MSVWKALDGARLVVGDEDLGRIFVWNGSAQVNIYDENFNEVDMFSMSAAFGRKMTAAQVQAVIDAHRREMHAEADS